MLPALTIAVPLLGACLLLATGRFLPRPVVDALATALSVGTAGLLFALVLVCRRGRVVDWVGGHGPQGARSVGTVLVADELSALLGLVAGLLTVFALLYSWRYFAVAEARFHAMMLLFLTGMLGFLFTGDLFTLFVFFELMSAVAYALTGYQVEEAESVQGALTFGVVNSLGAYFSLMGIGLLYARTGQLGLAQLGAALSHGPRDLLVVAAFAFVSTGLLVKAAAVPFHFWLADAHAVAPTPVCVLFSGIMVELGLYGLFRVQRIVFDPVLPTALPHVATVLGIGTAVLGAVLCCTQRHLKRLLAFSTVAHTGVFLGGLSAANASALAGFGLSVAGHAGVKGTLFLLTGILRDRYRSVDVDDLHGRVEHSRFEAVLFLLAGLALAGLPPFALALGKATAEDAGPSWLLPVSALVSVATAGAVMHAGARIYFGLGAPPPRDAEDTTSGEHEEPETGRRIAGTPAVMAASAAGLLALALAAGLLPAVREWASIAGAQAADRIGYLHAVLPALPAGAAPDPADADASWRTSGVVTGLLTASAGAAAVAFWHRWRVPAWPSLHRLHSGHVGDYVAWLLAGVPLLAALVLA
ncbi:complex I subunit 5 family protein [Amycolatopsis benzoatilytica]|uniref:complex I subunit 5 family protein n=1 Tax=Amycolatopsis benzoatilytica TaxID=346045 RepID=UPI000377697C|nr:complex I subunit 5 family protein [Amycolatopsis benzoatilytica]